MDHLLGLRYLTRVVESESFSVCAREFGVTPSSVTRVINGLEESLGISLLHRSTRKVLPTEAGKSYFLRAKRILVDLDEAGLEAMGLGKEPKGTLRVSIPIGMGQMRLGPLLPKFLGMYPKIRVETELMDEYIDLLADSIDVGIRVGIHKESSLRASKIENYRRVLCASPSYLKKHGTPKSVEDLAHHQCLTFNYGPGSDHWHFKTGGKIKEVGVKGPLCINSVDTILLSARQGLGLCLPPAWAVIKDLRQGTLVEVLPSVHGNLYPNFNESLYAVYVGQRPAPKIRVFIDFIKKEFSGRF